MAQLVGHWSRNNKREVSCWWQTLMTIQLEWQLTRLRSTCDAWHKKWGVLGWPECGPNKNTLEASIERIKWIKKNRTQEDCEPRQRKGGERARQQRLTKGRPGCTVHAQRQTTPPTLLTPYNPFVLQTAIFLYFLCVLIHYYIYVYIYG